MMLRTMTKTASGSNHVVSQGHCPACGSSDANTLYSDGSAWCFSCQTYTPATSATFVPKMRKIANQHNVLNIAPDLSNEYGKEALEWAGRYHMTVEDLLRSKAKWSAKRRQLTWLFNDMFDGTLALIHSRNFRDDVPKYYNDGVKERVAPIFGEFKGELVLVEDVISAIRVSKVKAAMPLFGTSLSLPKVTYLKRKGLSRAFIWLDHDKLNVSYGIGQALSFTGVACRSYYTDLDPKCYTDGQIVENLK